MGYEYFIRVAPARELDTELLISTDSALVIGQGERQPVPTAQSRQVW